MGDSVYCETQSLSQNIQAQIEARQQGRRKKVLHGGALCSCCLTKPPRLHDRYCGECRSKYNTRHRKAERDELKRLRKIFAATPITVETLTPDS